MATFFNYFEVTMNYLRTNKWLLMWMFAGLTGTGVQTLEVQAKEEEKNIAIREVAVGFQSVNAGLEPKAIPKVTIKSCDKCMEAVNKLRKEFHP